MGLAGSAASGAPIGNVPEPWHSSRALQLGRREERGSLESSLYAILPLSRAHTMPSQLVAGDETDGHCLPAAPCGLGGSDPIDGSGGSGRLWRLRRLWCRWQLWQLQRLWRRPDDASGDPALRRIWQLRAAWWLHQLCLRRFRRFRRPCQLPRMAPAAKRLQPLWRLWQFLVCPNVYLMST